MIVYEECSIRKTKTAYVDTVGGLVKSKLICMEIGNFASVTTTVKRVATGSTLNLEYIKV